MRTLRFFPEYSAGHPFWGEYDLIDMDRLHLSSDLRDDILAWNEYFEFDVHWENGWAESADGTWFADHRRELAERAQTELGADCAVIYEVWP